MIPQRQVFYVSNFTSNESLDHQHMSTTYHDKKILSANTSKSHEISLIIQRYDLNDWSVGSLKSWKDIAKDI